MCLLMIAYDDIKRQKVTLSQVNIVDVAHDVCW